MGLKPPEGTELGPLDPSKASALTGHVFNMLHDNSKPCVGLNGPGSTSRHVMAPVMAHVDPEEPWSPCSARFITDFLDNGYGKQMAAPSPWAALSSCPPPYLLFCSILHGPNCLPQMGFLCSVGWGEKCFCLCVVPTSSSINSIAKGGNFWCNRMRADLLRVKTVCVSVLAVKGVTCDRRCASLAGLLR